jgi:adenine-specific DNA methylase
MYAVVSQVPVQLTYRNGDVKIRYLWRFRAPADEDIAAVEAAEFELALRLPEWEARGLVPDEAIPVGEKTREPHNAGLTRWRDLFLPRQLLTNLVVLEEIRGAQERIRAELPPEQAEAMAVYLAFMLDKVVNYNSVNTFWDYTRNKGAQTFSRHDFAFRAAFTEFEGARETVMWAGSQVIDAYSALCALIHGGEVNLDGDDEDLIDADDVETESRTDDSDAPFEDPATHLGASARDPAPALPDLRPEVIVPTVTCEDAAALSVPAPGTVHLICVDPPYYNNVQYAELSNFFYVWLKRALKDLPGLAHLFSEPLAETNREAVANAARWQREAEAEQTAWKGRYEATFERLRAAKVKVKDAKDRAAEEAGPKPPSAKDRADLFYENKMAAVFARGRKLLHPAGRMVVMFNHKQTWAWRSLGMALIRAGFEVRSSVPIHTEAESSLNIRGLDAARSTVLLMCVPREERAQQPGNWSRVQSRVGQVARGAAQHFQTQGLAGTDLYLASLGPALGEVGRNWPVTDFSGRPVDLVDALEEAYKAVGQWRLEQLFETLTRSTDFGEAAAGFSAQAVDRDTQTLWLWLDTFQGEIADSDDVRKLAKSLGVNPDDLKGMGLLEKEKDLFILRPPQDVDHRLLARRLKGVAPVRGLAAREADVWEERVFPGFIGAAVWHALGLMAGSEGARGPDALGRWMRESGYGAQREFFGAYAVTLSLLEQVFRRRREGDAWGEAAHQARRGWDLVLKTWRA